MKYPILAVILCLLGVPVLAADSVADQAKAEVIAADRAFAAKAAKDGVLAAFLAYCTKTTKFLGSRTLKGTEAARAMFSDTPAHALLSWSPDYAEASVSGDLAFTYGRYQYSQPVPGKPAITASGTYVTIWKRQADGSWKFVLDGGAADPKSHA